MNHFHCKKINNEGFTLVEILVVLGIFSFLMTLATGVLYATQAVNVKLQETQAVLDNMNLSLETISRDIRYGSEFHCGTSVDEEPFSDRRKSCPYENQGGSVLFFKPSDGGERVAYYASTTSYGSVILKDEYGGDATSTFQVTADDVRIKSLMFYVSGAYTSATNTGENVGNVSDFEQPIITMVVSGETIPIKEGASSTKFVMQTSVSPRELDK